MGWKTHCYKIENIEKNRLKNMWKNHFLKIKNSFLELEKDFIELEDKELKGGEVKIKTEIEELFFKPITVSINDMDRFEKKKWKK